MEIIRTIINLLVSDLIDCTEKKLEEKNIHSYMDVKRAPERVAGFSENVSRANEELKRFLRHNLYQNYLVRRVSLKSQKVISDLFSIYTGHPDTLPESYRDEIERNGIIRTVTDFIAGMTDRYALEEHRKLTDPLARV
jgi:dGTPase